MKKFFSLLLSVMILLGTFAISAQASGEYKIITLKQAISDYEKKTGETLSTNRYYFLMPDGKNGKKGSVDTSSYYNKFATSWYNEFTDTAGIYWWDCNEINPAQWPGYEMSLNDHYGVFRADVPESVGVIVFNNCVNGGLEPEESVYYKSEQSINIDLCGYEKNESDTYPDGLSDFSDMIYVIDPCKSNRNELGSKLTHMGEWYYYYGTGCYGTVENGTTENCIRDDHDHEHMFINFDLNSTGWTDVEKVYCALGRGSGDYYPYKSLPMLCSDDDGDGIYTYDLNKPKFKFEQYARYSVTFFTEPYHSTQELTMQIGNIGDTVYSTGEFRPADSRPFIAWKNEIPLELRPLVSLKDAVSEYEAQTGETIETNRYYFLMPNGKNGIKGKINSGFSSYYLKYCDSWYNEYTDTAGIYWNSGGEFKAPKYYGYTMEKGDSDCVFYADVPESIEIFTFTNALEKGYNYYDDTYHLARQSYPVTTTLNVDADKASPDKDYSYDNMICVLDPCDNSKAEMTYPVEFSGRWYYYYGNGCYGKAQHGTEKDCLRDDHKHEVRLDYREEFFNFCSVVEGETPLTYSDPLYYYYEEGSSTPAWFLAEGYNSYEALDYTYGVFGDYYIQRYSVDSPSKLSLYVYLYDEQKFYTLEDAWEKGFVDKEMAFIEYFKPNYAANLIGDANKDHKLSVIDATYIQMAQAGLRELFDELGGEQCCGAPTAYMTDFDHDGERSILDATAIQLKLAKLQ